jgi:hypothetical protein
MPISTRPTDLTETARLQASIKEDDVNLLNRLEQATKIMRIQDASPRSYLSVRHEYGKSYLRKMTPSKTGEWPLCEDFGPFENGEQVIEYAEKIYPPAT